MGSIRYITCLLTRWSPLCDGCPAETSEASSQQLATTPSIHLWLYCSPLFGASRFALKQFEREEEEEEGKLCREKHVLLAFHRNTRALKSHCDGAA